MNLNIKKLLLTTFMVLSAVWFSFAQNTYKKTVRTEGEAVSITDCAVNVAPYRNKDIELTRILAKNGVEFAITFPESYQNLSIVRNNRRIEIQGRKVISKEPGNLSFTYTYTENGVSYTCDVLGDVNYYGELEYQGRTNLSDNPIVVTNANKNDYLSIPQALSSVEWMLYRNVFEADKKTINYDQLAECQNTTFSYKNVISFDELLTLKNDQILDGKLKLLLLFEDRSSNALSNGVPGGTSVQAITLVDARTYKVNLSQEGQGTVPVAKNEFTAGESVALTAQAAQGWQFSHWEENGQSLGTANPLTFTMEAQHRTIKAVFTQIPKFTVTLQIVDTKGAILARSQQQRVQSGGNTSFQVPNLPNTNFKGWYHNGQLVGTGNTYSLSNITQDETIQAVFEIPVQTVALSFTELSLKVGERGELPTATVTPNNASDKSISWASDNETVAKIEDGRVVGVSSGTTQLIASSANGKTAALQVVVTQQPQQPQVVPVQSVTVTPASITAKVGDAPVQLTATVLPANATTPTVSWLSANEQVVKVDSNGKVTIIAAGETTIEAKAGEKSFTVQVKVAAAPQQPQQPQVIPVQSVTVTPASITAKVGDAPVQLTATVLPANATSPTVSWQSANEQVVKVDSNGKVTIIAAGETTIEAKTGEKTFTVQVKVEVAPPVTPPAEEFPPYIKDFPTEITQGTAINIGQWEFLGNINASQIRYHFTDADGKVLGVAPATLQANTLTFTQSGNFVLVATLPANTAGWTEVRFSITVKIKN